MLVLCLFFVPSVAMMGGPCVSSGGGAGGGQPPYGGGVPPMQSGWMTTPLKRKNKSGSQKEKRRRARLLNLLVNSSGDEMEDQEENREDVTRAFNLGVLGGSRMRRLEARAEGHWSADQGCPHPYLQYPAAPQYVQPGAQAFPPTMPFAQPCHPQAPAVQPQYPAVPQYVQPVSQTAPSAQPFPPMTPSAQPFHPQAPAVQPTPPKDEKKPKEWRDGGWKDKDWKDKDWKEKEDKSAASSSRWPKPWTPRSTQVWTGYKWCYACGRYSWAGRFKCRNEECSKNEARQWAEYKAENNIENFTPPSVSPVPTPDVVGAQSKAKPGPAGTTVIDDTDAEETEEEHPTVQAEDAEVEPVLPEPVLPDPAVPVKEGKGRKKKVKKT